ncbi:MAG: hypothetical protein U0X20_10445 [Caldilineaceae bacterium]
MRWYWILVALTLLVLASVSPATLRGLLQPMPSSAGTAIPIVLLSLAVLSAFAALVLSSRSFGMMALVLGLGVTYMQQEYLHALARYARAMPGSENLELSLTMSNILHGTTGGIANDAPWLLPLTLCALLLAGVLIAGPKVE